ncbi:MAG: cbb3-type cytochrome c oxidase N-terminal domain-containing protein [Bacteriovorax sp.]|nr:cbb3-type cytochrome c oxidase N-terminal domain-containing protein [Bacteriovorax sp.]
MSDKTDLHIEEDEKHILLDHSYDGIQELDNPLPSWWKLTFYLGIIFAIFYFILYQVMGAPTLRDEFNKEWAEIVKLQEKFNLANGKFDEVKFLAIVKDDGVKKGQLVFETNCTPCHKDKGIGDIGPNLTDEYWINSKGTPATNYTIVFNGVPDKGMPTWSQTLSNDEIYQVVSYVQTLHNTHQPGGKAPQGEKIEDEVKQ